MSTAAPFVSPADDALQRTQEAPQRLVLVDGQRRMTRAELLHEAQCLGSALRRRGLAPGAAIAFQLPNWHEACVLNLAAVLYGFRLVPLLPMYREAEIGFILGACRVDAVFVPERFRGVNHVELLHRAQPAGLAPDRVFIVRGEDARHACYAELLQLPPAGLLPPTPADPDAVKMVLFTSGSTGRPKGVLHTHRSIASLIDFTGAFWGLAADDVALVPSPVGHIGGSMYAFEFPWRLGMTAVLMDTWQADTAIGLIEREGVSFCAGATPFLADLVKAAGARDTSLPTLRRFVCGGASVPPALVEAATARFTHCTVARAYGSTEVPVVCAGVRTRADAFFGATTDGEIGADIALLDDAGQPVAEGEVGEIVARAPRMFAGYLAPEDNAGAFTADGHFRMGDLGRVVAGRFLEIRGRKKELIIRLGENISPLEVENVLAQHPAVAQVAIVGIPDARTGEAALAFVVPRAGAPFTLAEMQRFLAERGLARQKFPEHLRLIDALPANAVGKVLKRELQRIGLDGGR